MLNVMKLGLIWVVCSLLMAQQPLANQRDESPEPRQRSPFGIVWLSDNDRDAMVTLAEWREFVDGLSVLDDGSIDLNSLRPQRETGEQRGRRRGPKPPKARAFDVDQNGVVEVSDFQALFALMDRNGDDVVTKDEVPMPPRRRRGGRN